MKRMKILVVLKYRSPIKMLLDLQEDLQRILGFVFRGYADVEVYGSTLLKMNYLHVYFPCEEKELGDKLSGEALQRVREIVEHNENRIKKEWGRP